MEKIDFKKTLKELYNPSVKEVSEVVVPAMNFLMIDGKGDPNTSKEFQSAIEALYPLAYNIKFDIKKSLGIDYGVAPLEGLWWAEDMADFTKGNRDNWQWTLMIMQPETVTKEIFEKNFEAVKNKKNPLALTKIRFEKFEEGKSAQIMHVGPYSDETQNILRLHNYISEKNCKLTGKHHEIYLSDFRRTTPEKLKTVIRQPFK
jgi:hypothetical protein